MPEAVAETDRRITLQVGERCFTTTYETLTSESVFFKSLLSGRWNSAHSDGTYFIDADPDIFVHILRYLRRGILPVFFDKVKGHDYDLYLSVLEEARYFQIDRLIKWLENKEYVNAVTVLYHSEEEDGAPRAVSKSSDCDATFYVNWGTKKVYVCPRGIYVHRGDPNRCGKACHQAQGDDDTDYEDEPVCNSVKVFKRVTIDDKLRVEGR